MKHPHTVLIAQWLEDTTQQIEIFDNEEYIYLLCSPCQLIKDIEETGQFRIKPKEFSLFAKLKPLLEEAETYKHVGLGIPDILRDKILNLLGLSLDDVLLDSE